MLLKSSSTSSRWLALRHARRFKLSGKSVHVCIHTQLFNVATLGVACLLTNYACSIAGLSGFAIFVSVSGIFFSLFMLLTPVIYEKYDKGARLARALKEVRVGFILSTLGLSVSLLISCVSHMSYSICQRLILLQIHHHDLGIHSSWMQGSR